MTDTPAPMQTPPFTDDRVWMREDRIEEALKSALLEAVETHGNKAKAIAWDIRSSFNRNLRSS